MKLHIFGLAFATLTLSFAVGCGKDIASQKGNFDIPPSLVSRMYQAHNVARDKMVGTKGVLDGEEMFALLMQGYDNGAEIASRPRGEMAFANDGFSDEERRKMWPFDFEAFESTLEAQMVRDENGLYRLKEDDEVVPSNPTIRWVNAEIEAWAVKQLDSKFTRMNKPSYDKLMKELDLVAEKPEGEEGQEEVLAWILPGKDGVNEYFLIMRNDGAWDIRSYTHVIWPEGSEPVVFAEFDSFPNKKEATAMLTWKTNPSSMNNMAVLYWQHRIFRVEMDPLEVKEMLELAAEKHVKCASKNLSVLLKHIPELKNGQ